MRRARVEPGRARGLLAAMCMDALRLARRVGVELRRVGIVPIALRRSRRNKCGWLAARRAAGVPVTSLSRHALRIVIGYGLRRWRARITQWSLPGYPIRVSVSRLPGRDLARQLLR